MTGRFPYSRTLSHSTACSSPRPWPPPSTHAARRALTDVGDWWRIWPLWRELVEVCPQVLLTPHRGRLREILWPQGPRGLLLYRKLMEIRDAILVLDAYASPELHISARAFADSVTYGEGVANTSDSDTRPTTSVSEAHEQKQEYEREYERGQGQKQAYEHEQTQEQEQEQGQGQGQGQEQKAEQEHSAAVLAAVLKGARATYLADGHPLPRTLLLARIGADTPPDERAFLITVARIYRSAPIPVHPHTPVSEEAPQ